MHKTRTKLCSYSKRRFYNVPLKMTFFNVDYVIRVCTCTPLNYIIQQPTLLMDNCLDANEVAWTYIVTLTSSENSSTYERIVDVPSVIMGNLMPLTKYNISVVPLIANFGLSGDAITFNIGQIIHIYFYFTKHTAQWIVFSSFIVIL